MHQLIFPQLNTFFNCLAKIVIVHEQIGVDLLMIIDHHVQRAVQLLFFLFINSTCNTIPRDRLRFVSTAIVSVNQEYDQYNDKYGKVNAKRGHKMQKLLVI